MYGLCCAHGPRKSALQRTAAMGSTARAEDHRFVLDGQAPCAPTQKAPHRADSQRGTLRPRNRPPGGPGTEREGDVEEREAYSRGPPRRLGAPYSILYGESLMK